MPSIWYHDVHHDIVIQTSITTHTEIVMPPTYRHHDVTHARSLDDVSRAPSRLFRPRVLFHAFDDGS